MRWLVRQWHRFQLARDLLAQHEWEEAHRRPWEESVQALSEAGPFGVHLARSDGATWKAAVEAHLAVREATRGTEAS